MEMDCHLILNLFLVSHDAADTEPNEFTFAPVLSSCTSTFDFELGRQMHSLIIKRTLETHIYVGSSLLDMYAKAGRIHEAREVFESLPERDVSCTSLISGIRFCKQVHNHVLRCKLLFYVVLQNSLMDMYSKCWNLIYSRRIFDNMRQRSVISWNAMLVGYNKHGMGRDVLELYRLMRNEKKVKPDSVTLLGVLSGCSHGGMEDVGLEILDEVVNMKDGIVPDNEHYGCVVDLLGRAGRVEEAFEFIKKMPYEPTAALWGSLLGACRVHSKIDIGEFVGRRLLEVEPENARNYVILSNLYASTGRWEDVRMVRDLMMEKVVKKEPGKSWIELDQTLHSFNASDRSHPRREEGKRGRYSLATLKNWLRLLG
ncbi:hypothetical protein REPUB_Repub02eG0186500 [Reevesia pubescens]